MAETITNDPIHGIIQISPLCVKIIDTPQFQRLRNIKQLGCCYYVYPGASHNRFEHSIGVCHLAGKLAHHLKNRMKNDMACLAKLLEKKDTELQKKNLDLEKKLKDSVMTENDLLCIEIAGLCHDLGHGPFSHLFDQFFYKEKSIVDDGHVPSDWKHENASMGMFQHMIDANEKLKDAFKKEFKKNDEQELEDKELQKILDFIKDLIIGKVGDKPAYMYEIVANKTSEIDVDKMDYFARDCHGLGMKSDFDHLRYIQNCRVMIVDDAGTQRSAICIRDKAVHDLYELFHTRNNLFRCAYFHKVSKAVDYMVNDALVSANDVIRIKVGKDAKNKSDMYPIFSCCDKTRDTNTNRTSVRMSEVWNSMSAYQNLTDGVLDYIKMSNEPKLQPSKKLLSRIHNRDLYKCVYESLPRKVTQDSSKQEKKVNGKIIKAGKDLHVHLSEKDFMVKKFTYSYGKKGENPVKSVFFFKKDTNECFKIDDPSKVSHFLPSVVFQEEIIRVYLKTSNKETALREAIKEAKIEEWLR